MAIDQSVPLTNLWDAPITRTERPLVTPPPRHVDDALALLAGLGVVVALVVATQSCAALSAPGGALTALDLK